MKEVTGNLVRLIHEGHFNVVIHGCNCMCTMGAGIAKSLREAFPAIYEADCQTADLGHQKLGTYTSARIERPSYPDITIVNAYTQYGYGQGVQIDYSAIQKVLLAIKADFSGRWIGLPKIGAGLGGGDWSIISSMILNILEREDVTLVNYDGT